MIIDKERLVLVIGDIITFALVTIIGFASHGTAGTAGTRMLTTFLPLLVAWFLISPFIKVYDLQYVNNWHQLWRPFWSVILAAPMAAWMRGVLLGTPILPLFVVILGGVSAVGMLIWRGLYMAIMTRISLKNG